MERKRFSIRTLVWLLVLLTVTPPWIFAQDQGTEARFKQEELDALLAPIALYPDDLLSQILMASTYPLEIVQADRWVKANQNLKGDSLAAALENQGWDPSVKSLVNFPQVLEMMSEKLDWTEKLGDAFLASEKDVMDTVQKLRFKAEEAGNLKSTEQQKVIVQEKVIVIEPAQPQVIYVPTYNPAVVYGTWWWPAYPPPPPFFPLPPRPVLYGGLAFGAGVAMGAAWGYAWGRCNWGRGNVNVNINQNININNSINRNNYARQLPAGGQGNWQHDASHRRGVPYRDQAAAQKYNKGSSGEAVRSREAYRGRGDQGGQALQQGRGTAGGSGQQASRQRAAGAGQQASQQRPGGSGQQASQQRAGGASQQASQQRAGGAGQQASQQRVAGAGQQASQQRTGGTSQQTSRQKASGAGQAGQQRRDNAFSGIGNGKQTQNYSNRGSTSRSGGSTGSGAGAGSTSSGSRGGGSSSGGARGGGGQR